LEQYKEVHIIQPGYTDNYSNPNRDSHAYTDPSRDADSYTDANPDSHANGDHDAYCYSRVNAYSKSHMALYVYFYHYKRAIVGISAGRQCCEQRHAVIPVDRR
jgi:hypothetical protein